MELYLKNSKTLNLQELKEELKWVKALLKLLFQKRPK